MQGKTVVISGANQGIGKAAAIALAAKGAHVVMVARNRAKGEAALEEVKKAGPGGAELVVADMAILADVRRAASEIKERHKRLDVLVNNAGLIVPERHTTADGYEETFAVNHLGYFLFTKELLDLLKASSPSRIVSVSSRAHMGAKMQWDDLQYEHTPYSAIKVYGQSKLANILFTYELARRLESTGVTANCLHPGVINSGFGKTYPGLLSFAIKLATPFLTTPEKGARTTVYLASSPEVEGVTGKYFSNSRPVRSNRESYDENAQRKLWALSEELVKARAKAA